jgi:hypothetical protein
MDDTIVFGNEIVIFNANKQTIKNSETLVLKRTLPTERPPLFGEISANYSG